MANGIVLDKQTANELVTSIRELKEEVSSLRKTLANPPYGSKAWWHLEIEKGEKEIKEGKYKEFKDAKSLIANLHGNS